MLVVVQTTGLADRQNIVQVEFSLRNSLKQHSIKQQANLQF